MFDQQANIQIITRTQFNNLSNLEKEGNVYFVTESTSQNPVLASLYIGGSKKSDMFDISEAYKEKYDNCANPYNIPIEDRVKNKLFCYKQYIPVGSEDGEDIIKTIYRIVMWDGDKFTDVASIPNNVIVIDEIPDTGIENYVYVETGTRNIYVYSNGEYIELVSTDMYATVDDVNTMYYNVLAYIKSKFGYIPYIPDESDGDS